MTAARAGTASNMSSFMAASPGEAPSGGSYDEHDLFITIFLFSVPYMTSKWAGKPRCCFTFDELWNLRAAEFPDNKCGNRKSLMGFEFR